MARGGDRDWFADYQAAQRQVIQRDEEQELRMRQVKQSATDGDSDSSWWDSGGGDCNDGGGTWDFGGGDCNDGGGADDSW